VALKMEAALSSEVYGIVCWMTVIIMLTDVITSYPPFQWIFVVEISKKCCAHLITVCICRLYRQVHMNYKCNLKHFLYTCWLYRNFVD
jgi:hypothetical protein